MTIVKNQSLAEEITQNTFYKAMTAKHTYEGKSSEFTWLCTMIWDTLWLYLTIFIVCYRSGMAGMKTGNIVTFVLMLGVWLIFLTIRYLPVNSFIKAGISTFLCSIWMIFSNDICTFLIEHKRQLTISHVNFSNWSTDISFNANVYMKDIFIVEADGSLTPIRLLNKHDNASVKRDKVRLTGGED